MIHGIQKSDEKQPYLNEAVKIKQFITFVHVTMFFIARNYFSLLVKKYSGFTVKLNFIATTVDFNFDIMTDIKHCLL